MDESNFKAIYGKWRNGTNQWVRHPLSRRLLYSDGVQELAELGCYWLLDVIGTEFVDAATKAVAVLDDMGFIEVDVQNSAADIKLLRDTGEVPLYVRHIDFTDMPSGKWMMYFSQDPKGWCLYLPTEY